MRISDIPKISRLTVAEKILFVEELWDSIATGEHIPIPESHKSELDRRLVKYQNHRGHLLSLKELQTRIEENK